MSVLIVDDDKVSRMALTDVLQNLCPLPMIEAEDGEGAWQLLEGGLTPVVCFCDVQMPKVNGLELLHRIRAHQALAQLPFVMVTSAADIVTVKHAKVLGICHYIVKPFNAADISQTINARVAHLWQEAMDDPASTRQRLGINADRLLIYADALHRQLQGLLQELPMLHQNSVMLSRLETLNTACLTLGLWHGAKIIRRMQQECLLHLDRERIERQLREIDALALLQVKDIKTV